MLSVATKTDITEGPALLRRLNWQGLTTWIVEAGPESVTGRFCWSEGKGELKAIYKVKLLNASPLAGVIEVGYIVLFMAAG